MDLKRDHGLARILAEFAHTLGTNFSVQEILDQLVLRIVDILPVTGAGVMLMGSRSEFHFVAASNDVITRIEALQNELLEGPCLEAYSTGEAVAVTDLSTDTRFPSFSPRAVAAGLAAVSTLPMRLDHSRLGAVDLYRDTPGGLSEQDLDAAQILADVAAAYLFNARARIDSSATVARLHHRSLHDPLTGLPNRTLLEELLAQGVARARRSESLAGVLVVGLDGFKAVNDRHGHHVGDQLLRAVAGRLTAVLRPGDTLARLGGHEFVALCENLASIADAETVAVRMTTALRVPFSVAGLEIAVSASVGAAFTGPGQDRPEVLLRNADHAMYQAKRTGGGYHRVLAPPSRLPAVARRSDRDDLADDLGHAARRGRLWLAYQPIHEVHSGELVAVEALLRWEHHRLGAVGPEAVIPSAERTGLIGELDEWVLRQACADLRCWREEGVGVPAVAVNVSEHQITRASFARTVEGILDETGVDPGAVSLELTEKVLLADAPPALRGLRELKALGLALTLDDFGTVRLSLSCLRQFPLDGIKIDRGFVAGVAIDTVTRSIVGGMTELSHLLDLTVTAEGIETARELNDLTELGVDRVQGHHLSRPLPAAALADYASAHSTVSAG